MGGHQYTLWGGQMDAVFSEVVNVPTEVVHSGETVREATPRSRPSLVIVGFDRA